MTLTWDRMIRIFVACLALMTFQVSRASAQDVFPNRPIRFVNPYPAGGPLDAIVRRLAESVSPRLGQPVIVENKAGANGTIAAHDVIRNADGYSYLVTVPDPLIHSAVLMKSLPYDPTKDFVLMTQVASSAIVLVANPDMPSSLGEVMALAKSKPGSVAFGSFGNGSQPHLMAETVIRQNSVQLNHVPYRGAGPALQDVLGKQIAFSFTAPIVAASMARDGKVKILAISGAQRSIIVPDVPTFSELGYQQPLFKIRYWAGVAAPAAAPKAAVDRVLREIRAAAASPEFGQFITATGWEVVNNSPEEFTAAFNAEYDLVGKLAVEFDLPRM
jgi:tripartite-type tricarboxylate transporter receptor subunit TctC